eukprot:CAMPEP_0194278496 /NCGR_PEP_ID=MMETSP0169-20130528/11395_1 /TAXON_ID=218684 /ORGANISM="Corethron pennatum, Strain L29A3" /LENGTH=84 /DNA_ID=CAMNT_0039022697 /DNA_START=555 /DNA_END=809 /DNA_ORIENTATION=-
MVIYFSQTQHRDGHGGIDVLSAADFVGQYYSNGVGRPGNRDAVLPDPFPRTECQADHEDRSNEFFHEDGGREAICRKGYQKARG